MNSRGSTRQTGFSGQRVGANKIAPVSMNRSVAQSPQPADVIGHGQHRTQISTYFTKAPTVGQSPEILYNGDRMWARLTLTLETAGPVAVGQSSSITPVLSGKGQLLETGVPTQFDIAKGTTLYIAATGINRVKVVVAAIPWLETITGLVGSVLAALRGQPVGTPATPPGQAR